MKHIKKIATYAAVGGFGAIIMAGLAGCGSDDGGNENALNEVAQKNGAFVIIEESAPGVYKILEELNAEYLLYSSMNYNENITIINTNSVN